MWIRTRPLLVASILAAVNLASTSNAAIIFGNLSATQDGTPSSLYNTNAKGMQFSPSSTFSITGLKLTLRDQNATRNPLSIVEAKLYKAATSGSFLITPAIVGFTAVNGTNLIGSSATTYDFTPLATASISAGTSYFLVVNGTTNPSNQVFQWLSTKTLPTSANSTFNGARSGTPTSIPNASTNYNLFELNGTVPEPSSAIAIALSSASLLLGRRRRTI